MALGRYTRVDGRKSSDYCSTITVVVFVALCSVGVWMMSSSSETSTQNVDVPQEKQKADVTQDSMNEINESTTTKFEGNPGGVSEDAKKVDGTLHGTRYDKSSKENTNDVPSEEKQKEKPSESTGEESKLDDEKKPEEAQSKKEDRSEDTKTIEEGSGETKPESDDDEKKSEESEPKEEKRDEGGIEENVDGNQDESNRKKDDETKNQDYELLPSGAQSDLLHETTTQNGAFSTQATESKNEKEAQQSSQLKQQEQIAWKLCNTTAGPDYIPCLDNWDGIHHLRSTKHYEHRERHCPVEPPTCLVPLPEGYKRSVEWPKSREKIWYYNIPHTKLAEVKGHQNWVKVSGEYLTFPGGGTQFKHGALHYIEFIENMLPDIAWGKQCRVVLDVGCGVASFGGFLFEKDVLTMSLAPKD